MKRFLVFASPYLQHRSVSSFVGHYDTLDQCAVHLIWSLPGKHFNSNGIAWCDVIDTHAGILISYTPANDRDKFNSTTHPFGLDTQERLQ